MIHGQDLEKQKASIRKGSKSFAVASLFFSRHQKEAAWKLYSWCRYCDDQIDEVSVEIAVDRVKLLQQQTELCWQDVPLEEFQFRGLQQVRQQYHLPLHYSLDLLRGMEMDVQGRCYDSLQELEEYCYCVAGVVGLMMCHIMGVRSDKALSHAVAMGKAMQLTNICRDIREDFERGRIYLPQSWMAERGVKAEELLVPLNRAALVEMQEKLLLRAEQLYEEGFAGLRFLSLRSAWAVLIAAKVYSQIGSLIRKEPTRGLENRIYVTLPRKIFLILFTLIELIPHLWHSLNQRVAVRAPGEIWSMK